MKRFFHSPLKILIILDLALIWSPLAHAQETRETSSQEVAVDDPGRPGAEVTQAETLLQEPGVADQDTLMLKKKGWMFVLPVMAYSPETRFIGGLSAGRYYRLDEHPDSRPSTTTPTFLYTANQQTLIFLPVDLYWQRDTYHATGMLQYMNYPDKFYGLGNDTQEFFEEDYTPRAFVFATTVQKTLLPNLYLGGSYDFATSRMVKTEEGGLIDSGVVPGSEGGIVSGLGLLADYDTRDNLFYPGRGSFLRAAASFYGSALGSDFDYSFYELDLRQYFTVSGPNLLALQGWAQFSTGNPPFQVMPKLSLRGYFEGRYRDRNVMVLQAEYRRSIWKRLGVALFGGAGQVAAEVNDFRTADFWAAYGWGIRFQVGGQERINIRMDFGYGENDSGTYFMIGEAF